MLIYLDAMIVQYCADYEDFIFGETKQCPVSESKFKKELYALRKLVELEQLGNWEFAASPQLISELYGGKPTVNQTRVYKLLSEAWENSDWEEMFPLESTEYKRIEQSLLRLHLNGVKDRSHLAQAIALNASWFLTNDNDIILKCREQMLPVRVARPSECLDEISIGLFLK